MLAAERRGSGPYDVLRLSSVSARPIARRRKLALGTKLCQNVKNS